MSFPEGRNIMFGGMSNDAKAPLVDLGSDCRFIRKREGMRLSSTLFLDAVIRFLRNDRDERPFVAFTAPRDPRNPPPRFHTCTTANPTHADRIAQMTKSTRVAASGWRRRLSQWG